MDDEYYSDEAFEEDEGQRVADNSQLEAFDMLLRRVHGGGNGFLDHLDDEYGNEDDEGEEGQSHMEARDAFGEEEEVEQSVLMPQIPAKPQAMSNRNRPQQHVGVALLPLCHTDAVP
jgi:hypothetical protein